MSQRTIDDLIYQRYELRDYLLECADKGNCRVNVIKNHEKLIDRCKYAFLIEEGAYAQEIRTSLSRLNLLQQYLLGLGMDLKNHHGLWLPAVADSKAGDQQINITWSENWVSKTVSPQELYDDLTFPSMAEVGSAIDHAAQSYPELQKCRESGKSYRVAVRDIKGELRTRGLNQYCIALGPMHITAGNKQYRKKRADAWRGVEEPLYKYVGREGATWWVYPCKGRGVKLS